MEGSSPKGRAGGAIMAPLFVPALDERKLTRAFELSVPALILDLEDAVADSRKVEARESLRRLERQGDSGVWVRINPLSSPFWREDAEAVAPLVDAIMVPKVETPAELPHLAEFLGSVSDTGPELVPIIETAAGLWNLDPICRELPDIVRQLALGLGDLSTDLAIPWDPSGIMSNHARAMVVVASRAHRLPAPLDSVYPRPQDLDGVRNEAAVARDMGFGGKMCIHPGQLAVVEEVFGPSEQELQRARRIVKAFHEAEDAGTAAVVVDDEFVDYPVVERAVQTLRRGGHAVPWSRQAAATGQTDSPADGEDD